MGVHFIFPQTIQPINSYIYQETAENKQGIQSQETNQLLAGIFVICLSSFSWLW